ncbi:ubiquinol-cytochrome C chaperone [Sphingomonas sp. KRR8]|uniref:ubiquinol-cytochrome C chaperone family protein n=1 Tax=Sphingomonas sp. KRR8 TaxID=2942996 RepID=UPI0020221462|nr:ubiquinol-cytochrome C chaperone family protein [Sphingomonas sp. KRR8]URD60155.1 ubiquinol-cytochrome C chaperone [Sphingomonas sp. KRR8]
MASLMRLFRREEPIAQTLYSAAVAKARGRDWFIAGEVPDTLEGRFSMLATLLALIDIRLERGGEQARLVSVSLAEAFVADMDAQHRQLGTGDPVMGKKVGGLVGALGGRVGAWRRAIDGAESWSAVAERSVFRGAAPNADALEFVERRLREFWAALEGSSDERLIAGQLP